MKLKLKKTDKRRVKPLEAVIRKMRIIENPQTSRGNVNRTLGNYEKRRRQLSYGKWYMKPEEYGRNLKSVITL